MTKLQVFWYLSEAVLLAIYIVFFAAIANNIWFGIVAGVLFVLLQKFVNKALAKIKVEK